MQKKGGLKVLRYLCRRGLFPYWLALGCLLFFAYGTSHGSCSWSYRGYSSGDGAGCGNTGWCASHASILDNFGCYGNEIKVTYRYVTGSCQPYYQRWNCEGDLLCCTDQCSADSVQCSPPSTWNSQTCTCNPPPPPPCQTFYHCETYFNNGNGLGVSLGPGVGVDTNYTGPGYYAMRLWAVDTCDGTEHKQLLMDVPGTCDQQGYCEPGVVSCDSVPPGGGSSSSAGSSSSSYEPPNCVCLGCFGGSCMVTCSDGSNRTCTGDFANCTELKNSPEWTECTAPGPNSGGSSSSPGGGSSAGPSSQDNAIDGLNALIDTVHHSNELQEVGHGIMRDGIEQNKNFFDDVRGFFGGLLSQITGIFNNTDNINKNTNNINKTLNEIKNKPRDTTIVNVQGDTINIQGDTNIINIPIDSAPGLPWDTAGAVAGYQGIWDSMARGLDTMINPDTIHTGPADSLVRGVYGSLDSGVGRIYRDTINALVNNGLQNSTLSGTGSNSCPAFLMASYPLTIGPVTFDLTRNVKLGQYVCTPILGGKTAWELGRILIRIVVSIACMFFLFKCATGTLGGDD